MFLAANVRSSSPRAKTFTTLLLPTNYSQSERAAPLLFNSLFVINRHSSSFHSFNHFWTQRTAYSNGTRTTWRACRSTWQPLWSCGARTSCSCSRTNWSKSTPRKRSRGSRSEPTTAAYGTTTRRGATSRELGDAFSQYLRCFWMLEECLPRTGFSV